MYSRPSSYPYPSSFKNIKDVEEYQKKLYASLMENDRAGEFYRDRATDADLKQLIFRPEWYGAKGDGTTDDTSKIQAAINAASAAGGGTVLLAPNTTYLLNTDDAYRKFICLKSNVNIIGCGYSSCLKVASGYGDSGFIALSQIDNATAASSTACDNIILSNFRIDCNDTGNQLTGSPVYTVAVAVFVGDNITIDGLWIDDNAGQQCICVGANTTPPTATRVRITNNRISNVADDPLQNDHSAIYSSCDGAVISGNIITNPAANAYARLTSTGLEIHGRNTDVFGNTVNYFRNGANLAATVSSSFNNRFFGNILNDVNSGVALWQVDPYTHSDLLISSNAIRITPNNDFSTDNTCCGITDTSYTGAGFGNITITNNLIETTALSTDGQVDRGIELIRAIDGLMITGNIFNDLGYEAIRITPLLSNCVIANNVVSSANLVDYTTGGDYRNVIIYVGATGGNNVVITNNSLNGSANTRYGVCVVYVTTQIGGLVVYGNLVPQATVAKEYTNNAMSSLSLAAGDIFAGTIDGADSEYVFLSGGGSDATGRGGFLQLVGNEYAADIVKGCLIGVAGAGNGTTYKGKIRLYTSGDYDGGTVSLELDERGNLKLGGATPSSVAENVFCQATGVDPDYSFPDNFQLYSSDITAGNAAPHFRTEAGDVVKIYAQAHIADLKTDYTTGDLDSEAEVIAAINATNTKINAILTALETSGQLKTS